ncbi:sigma-E factor negative regulatory protein [Halomonas sp. ML-15]|uniref:sigma-E factor negative regulatory protein n=1 Tax=Halomonas sp. ML-15 TaxID=2773305 RepID=UPI00174793A5|nr:sigma-E factor negative regulatory protein [Halomonas sp. ML-15]MBD3897480.1 sigma-E factor negative regulatory protein [Halomonas sp. ML-15]
MNQHARESLSALMDNEGDELEVRRVLKSLDGQGDDADAWRRYHLARSLMQRDRDVDVSTDLSAGIMAKIAEEPLPVVEQPSTRKRSGLSFSSSAAIAAAVSLMVITGVQVYHGGDSDGAASQPALAGGSGAQGAAQAVPASAGNTGAQASRPSLVDLPMFQSPAQGGSSGIMTVGASAEMPMFMAPSSRQSQRGDQEQAQLLQSYLDRHAEGATYRSGDAWMPLLRASGTETLGQR